jgi:hypothetical protein
VLFIRQINRQCVYEPQRIFACSPCSQIEIFHQLEAKLYQGHAVLEDAIYLSKYPAESRNGLIDIMALQWLPTSLKASLQSPMVMSESPFG